MADCPLPVPFPDLGQRGEMLKALSPLGALRRMEYQFALDPNRFSFTNGNVPLSAYQQRGACLLAWGAFYCKLADRFEYVQLLLPDYCAKFGMVPTESHIYVIAGEKNPRWYWRGDHCAAAIPHLIEQLLLLNPALV